MPRDMQLRMQFADDAVADLARRAFVLTLDRWVEDYVGVIDILPDDVIDWERGDGKAALRDFAAWVEATLSKGGET